MIRHPREQRLYELAVSGEPLPPRFVRHLDSCSSCRAHVSAWRATLRISRASAAVPAPPDGFDARLSARLNDCSEPQSRSLRPALGWSLAAAVLLAATLVWFYPRLSARTARPSAPASPSQVRARVVRAAAAGQLDRAEMLLVSLAHAPNSPSAPVVDLSLEQAWARELLDSTRLIQQSAALDGQARLAQVLGDLEPVLLQIAHTPAAVSRAQWQLLQDRVTASQLLFRVRIAGHDLAPSNSTAEDGTL